MEMHGSKAHQNVARGGRLMAQARVVAIPALFALMACSVSSGLATSPTLTSSADEARQLPMDLPMASPESVGMSSERLGRLDAAMQRYIDADMVAGVVTLVARRGEVVHLKAQGHRYIEDSDAMGVDDIFVIMSMTKPIVSTALMMLFEEGYFPRFWRSSAAAGAPEARGRTSEKQVAVRRGRGVAFSGDRRCVMVLAPRRRCLSNLW